MSKKTDSEDRSTYMAAFAARAAVLEPAATGRTTRRRFLRAFGTSSLLGAVSGCGSQGDAAPEAFGDVTAGNVSALAVGDLQAVSGAPAVMGRDADGLYAMTATCTHEGCNMLRDGSVSRDGVYCSCHGSHFDVTGNALSGPAHAPLTHFAVSVDVTGVITVHGGTTVAAATRTPVA